MKHIGYAPDCEDDDCSGAVCVFVKENHRQEIRDGHKELLGIYMVDVWKCPKCGALYEVKVTKDV